MHDKRPPPFPKPTFDGDGDGRRPRGTDQGFVYRLPVRLESTGAVEVVEGAPARPLSRRPLPWSASASSAGCCSRSPSTRFPSSRRCPPACEPIMATSGRSGPSLSAFWPAVSPWSPASTSLHSHDPPGSGLQSRCCSRLRRRLPATTPRTASRSRPCPPGRGRSRSRSSGPLRSASQPGRAWHCPPVTRHRASSGAELSRDHGLV